MSELPATLVIYGRWWYDFLVFIVITAFFLIECLLLWRKSIIGWAMTLKCLTLAGVFGWALVHPPPIVPEEITLETMIWRVALVVVLTYVVAVLIWMRIARMIVIVGTQDGHDTKPTV